MEAEDYTITSAGKGSPIRIMAERGAIVTVNISTQRHTINDMVQAAGELAARGNTFPNWIAVSFALFLVAGAFAFVNADVHAAHEELVVPAWVNEEVFDYPEYWGYGRL